MSGIRNPVLVVDDEEVVRQNIVAYLEDDGLVARGAESAEQALEILAQQEFGVAIIDLRLPGMDGNALIVHAAALQPRLKFIVHTGSSNYTLPPELVALGVTEDDVFHKPVMDMSAFVAKIRQLLAGGS